MKNSMHVAFNAAVAGSILRIAASGIAAAVLLLPASAIAGDQARKHGTAQNSCACTDAQQQQSGEQKEPACGICCSTDACPNEFITQTGPNEYWYECWPSLICIGRLKECPHTASIAEADLGCDGTGNCRTPVPCKRPATDAGRIQSKLATEDTTVQLAKSDFILQHVGYAKLKNCDNKVYGFKVFTLISKDLFLPLRVKHIGVQVDANLNVPWMDAEWTAADPGAQWVHDINVTIKNKKKCKIVVTYVVTTTTAVKECR